MEGVDLTPIEAYYDTVPRAAATTEEVGPFTAFLARPGIAWDFYARPRLGLDREITPGEVIDVLARLTELGRPAAIEWVDQVTPSLLPAVRAALPDARVQECPLLVLPPDMPTVTTGAGTYVDVPFDSPDLDLVTGTISAGFAGSDEVAPQDSSHRRALIDDGLLAVVAAYDGDTVVGGGSAAPRGDTAELMGISVLPRARRRGHGGAITAALVAAARARGVTRVFLSAASHEAASTYRRVGFAPVGTACILALPREP